MSEVLATPRVRRRIVAIPVMVAVALTVLITPAAAIHTRPPATSTPSPPPSPSRAASAGGLAALIGGLFGGGAARPPAQSPPAPSPTTAASTPTTVGNVPTMQVGSSGELVKRVEQKLDAMKYFVGAIDGQYDEDTKQAVLAFQKVHGRDRTGVVTTAVYNALHTASDPSPLVPGGPAHRVEIDLGRQVLFLYQGGNLAKVIAVSSGTSSTPTPTGDYAIYHQSRGWETSSLGRLYNSQYFVGGYAIHGSLSVPAEPASHGCVRLPMAAADWFPGQVRIGTPVFIR